MTQLGKAGPESVGRRDGRTVSKKRLLERHGWRVINFSYLQAEQKHLMKMEEKARFWAKLLGPYGILPREGK